MRGERKSLFIFLMGLAWKFRFSMPLLLSSTMALLGRAWMFQIRVQSVRGLSENERYQRDEDVLPHLPLMNNDPMLAYYDDDEEDTPADDEMSWETESSDSWETLVEEVAYG